MLNSQTFCGQKEGKQVEPQSYLPTLICVPHPTTSSLSNPYHFHIAPLLRGPLGILGSTFPLSSFLPLHPEALFLSSSLFSPDLLNLLAYF